MNITELYQDFSVDFKTEGHKHCRPGWINTPCPFCISDPGHEGYHLGYNITGSYFKCWRCGWHPFILTISKLINVSESQVGPIIRDYGGYVINKAQEPEKLRKPPKTIQYPSNVGYLLESHKDYLYNRNFDPEKIEKEWNILSTGPTSYLKNNQQIIDYRFRILIPYLWDEKIISFDTRDVTNRNESKYKACPIELEIIPHKHILYGNQKFWKETGIIVEGPTDVWRFGPLSSAVSGIEFTNKQVRLIAKSFKRVAVVFDGGESQAIKQANKLVSELKFRRVDAFRVDIIDDPGKMDQKEANYLVKQLIK